GEAEAPRGLPRLRVHRARGLHHARSLARRPRARAVRHPPPLVPGALLPERGGGGGPPRRHRVKGARAEALAKRWYRLRGYRILGTRVWVAGNELDLVVRRGRRLAVVE